MDFKFRGNQTKTKMFLNIYEIVYAFILEKNQSRLRNLSKKSVLWIKILFLKFYLFFIINRIEKINVIC